MTNADLLLTFPVIQGLRISNYSMQDDGQEIIGDAPVEVYLPDGSLRIMQHVDYDKADWPIGRNLFIDFTTSAPESNDIPQWSGAAPNNNSIIPIMTGMEYLAVTGEEISQWASDSNGWGIDCEFDNSAWSSRQDSDGNLFVTSPSTVSSTAECSIKDPFGAQNNDTLTFTFGQPFTANGQISDGENIDFTLTFNETLVLLVLFTTFPWSIAGLNIKYCPNFIFIKSIKKQKIQYLKNSKIYVYNKYIYKLLQIIFYIEKPVAPVEILLYNNDEYISTKKISN